MLGNNKIVITGGYGRFGKLLKKKYNSKNIFYPTKKQLNILSTSSIINFLKKKKPTTLIHLAGLSRPMDIHEKNITKSIDLNIIGTANIVKICSILNIKVVYFSTHYVYPGKKGNYKETDPVYPINNYAWSKLAGECAVNMYKNSLILRLCMTEKPFIHEEAFYDLKTNFIFHEDVIKFLPNLITEFGIINIGGKKQSVFDFAKKFKKNLIRASVKKSRFFKNTPNLSIDISKLKKLLKIK